MYDDPLPQPSTAGGRAGRLHELDALRGVAAISVVLFHSFEPFSVMHDNTTGDGLTAANVFKYSPLHALFAGYPAVIIFFVLSGLVLALPFVEGRGSGYLAFVVKRVFRLWPPYLVALAFTFVLVAALHDTNVSGLSSWFAEKWTGPASIGQIAGHATLIGHFDNNEFNPVVWSLVHEMRISLLFPALVLATLLLGWKRGLPLALLLSLAAVAARSDSPIGSYLSTFKYLPCFIAGILLAVHWKTLTKLIQTISGRIVAALAAVALLAYTWTFWLSEDYLPGPLGNLARNRVTDLVVLTVGATLIVLLTQRQGGVRNALQSRIPQFLGRISYSIYLIHVPVLLAILHLLGPSVDAVLLLPLAWAASLVLADVMQRTIEGPSQALGRRLARHPSISRPDRVVRPVLARPSEPAPAAVRRS